MADPLRLLILAGDGIGPEVMGEVRRAIDWYVRRRGIPFNVSDGLVGGAALDARGVPITDDTMADAKAADAVLLGAVGGPKWDSLPFECKPERGLLRLRKDLGLFANLRPATVFDALVDASPLKADIVRGLDILIIRELTGGVYFGEPRGVTTGADGRRRGVNTHTYDDTEIDRIARVAFDLARGRAKRVCSVEKSNVMESGLLWRQVVQEVRDADFPDIELSHMYADNCAMQLIRNPGQFDVILTDNLFGDMLSDEAAMLTGSLGMLPSASLGEVGPAGRRPALYEPVHGSAPDIAGKGLANPLAAMLSFGMCLRHSFALDAEAALLEAAVRAVLDGGLRTTDIMQAGKARVSTRVMGEAVVRELEKVAA